MSRHLNFSGPIDSSGRASTPGWATSGKLSGKLKLQHPHISATVAVTCGGAIGHEFNISIKPANRDSDTLLSVKGLEQQSKAVKISHAHVTYQLLIE